MRTPPSGHGRSVFVSGAPFYESVRRANPAETERVATLEDLVHARLVADWTASNRWVKDMYDLHDPSLELDQYYVSSSAVFRGIGAAGKGVLLVCHALRAAGFVSSDDLTPERFLDLEAGRYGPVQAFDLDAVRARFDVHHGNFTLVGALAEPFLLAVLGAEAKAYLCHHHAQVVAWYVRPGGPAGAWAEPTPESPQFLSFDACKFLHARDRRATAGGYLYLGALQKTAQHGSRYDSLVSELDIVAPEEDMHRFVLVPDAGPLVSIVSETKLASS